MRTHLARRFSVLSLFTLSLVAAAACGRREARAGQPLGVTDIDVGRSIKSDLTINDKTTTFHPTDVIYISVGTKGSGNGTLDAHWIYQDSQQVANDTRTLNANGPAHTEFHLAKPSGWPTGKYHVEIILNGVSVGTKDFEVK